MYCTMTMGLLSFPHLGANTFAVVLMSMTDSLQRVRIPSSLLHCSGKEGELEMRLLILTAFTAELT